MPGSRRSIRWQTYTATFTADRRLRRHRLGDGDAGSYTDVAGNTGVGGADNVDIDTRIRPSTVDIVDGALSDSDNSSLVTFTFSEALVGLRRRRHDGRWAARLGAAEHGWSASLDGDVHGRPTTSTAPAR